MNASRRRGRPLHRVEVADPSERVAIDRQTELRGARREREHAARVDLHAELERDPVVADDDAVAERAHATRAAAGTVPQREQPRPEVGRDPDDRTRRLAQLPDERVGVVGFRRAGRPRPGPAA